MFTELGEVVAKLGRSGHGQEKATLLASRSHLEKHNTSTDQIVTGASTGWTQDTTATGKDSTSV